MQRVSSSTTITQSVRAYGLAISASRYARGFSLIELLVVVAIIALLIGLVLPAMSLARDSAQAVASASNMRQIGIAFQMYMDDHDGSMPRTTHDTLESRTWVFTLAPYVNDRAPATIDAIDEAARERVALDKVRLCPADPLGQGRLSGGGSSYLPNEYVVRPITAFDPSNPFGPPEVIADFSNRANIRNQSSTHTLFVAADGLSASLSNDHTHSTGWALPAEDASARWAGVCSDIEPGRFGGDDTDIEIGNFTGEPLAHERTGRSPYLFFDGHVSFLDASVLADFVIAGDDFARPR